MFYCSAVENVMIVVLERRVLVYLLDGIVTIQSVIRVTNNEIKDSLVRYAIKRTELVRPKKWHSVPPVPSTFYESANVFRLHSVFRVPISDDFVFRFVHRTCDPEADSFTYQKKNEMLPDYQYVCPMCKKFGKPSKRKESAYIELLFSSTFKYAKSCIVNKWFDYRF